MATTVEIEKFELEGNLRRIIAAIVVDREAHKAIVIGKGGETAQADCLAKRVRTWNACSTARSILEVWVKVKSGWSDDERLLKSLGYE